MYGERDDPYTAIARLGRTLASSLQLDTVLSNRRRDDRSDPRAAVRRDSPSPEAPARRRDRRRVRHSQHRLPRRFRSSTRGSPSVSSGSQRGQASAFRERDHRLIADLAPQVAAAVHAVGLSQELQLARQRIVSFAKRSGGASAATCTTASGPLWRGSRSPSRPSATSPARTLQRADELLVSATEQVQTMIGDVRQLIYGLRPPRARPARARGLAPRDWHPRSPRRNLRHDRRSRTRCPRSPPPSRSRPTGSPRRR